MAVPTQTGAQAGEQVLKIRGWVTAAVRHVYGALYAIQESKVVEKERGVKEAAGCQSPMLATIGASSTTDKRDGKAADQIKRSPKQETPLHPSRLEWERKGKGCRAIFHHSMACLREVGLRTQQQGLL